LILLGLSGLAARGAAPAPAAGLHDRIVCQHDPAQSYALFVPSGYTAGQKAPLLLCFDPRARGALPVRLFAAAAERHGIIVAGSYNSRNGPFEVSNAAAAAMVRDLAERFAINPQQVYAAGFSGGARVASTLGLAGLAKAVIACGGGFTDADRTPERLNFDFFGLAGSEDFNLPEMRRIEGDLKFQLVAHHFAVFGGDHAWFPESHTEAILSWLEDRDRHAALRERYRRFATSLLERKQAAFDSLGEQERYVICTALLAHAEPWTDSSALRRHRKQIITALPDRGAATALERQRKAAFATWQREAQAKSTEAAATLDRWRRQARAAQAVTTEAITARGALNEAVLFTCERAVEAIANGRANTEGIYWARLAAATDPQAPLLTYNLACAAALAGRPAEAAAALRDLIAGGVLTPADVAREPLFAKIRDTPEFGMLLQESSQPSGATGVQDPTFAGSRD